MPELINIADILPLRAEQLGDRPAIRCPGTKGPDGFARYDDLISYADLDRRSHHLALGFQAYGIGRGQRAVVMLRPSIEFFLVMFALFKAGAVPVLVAPGIARSALKQCLREAAPQAFIGIALAQAAKLVLGWAPDVRLKVTDGRFALFGGQTLRAIEALGRASRAELPQVDGEDTAAILFTSGSTGVPKGVLYRHRHFTAQVRLLQQAFAVEPGGVSLPTFPPVALFDQPREILHIGGVGGLEPRHEVFELAGLARLAVDLLRATIVLHHVHEFADGRVLRVDQQRVDLLQPPGRYLQQFSQI